MLFLTPSGRPNNRISKPSAVIDANDFFIIAKKAVSTSRFPIIQVRAVAANSLNLHGLRELSTSLNDASLKSGMFLSLKVISKTFLMFLSQSFFIFRESSDILTPNELGSAGEALRSLIFFLFDLFS